MSAITIVTGLWNSSNDKIFKSLQKCDYNMCIYIDPSDETFVWNYRSMHNTKLFFKKLADFEHWFEFYPKIKTIHNNPDWNMIINLSKMFLLHDAKLMNPFDSSYFFWIDSDILEVIDQEYIKYSNKLPSFIDSIDKFIMLSYTCGLNDRKDITRCFVQNNLMKYCSVSDDNYICSGKVFGGENDMISKMNNMYYGYLNQILNDNSPGDVEFIFTIISHSHPTEVYHYELTSELSFEEFFSMLSVFNKKHFSDIKTNLYILTYNFPEQLQHLLESFKKVDVDFINKPKKYLLNNSTDETTFEKYDTLCKEYDLEQIKKNNIGICGGRQFIAEHFDQSGADYYIFFEDDMLLHENNNAFCYNGFRRWIPNLYDKTLKIMHKEKYDYLKISFTEVYGGNEIQWSWYNVPDTVRHNFFPNKLHKPLIGLDPNPPATQFEHIKRFEDVTYIEGEIYYCNWPMWFNKCGNRKVFLEPKYEHPYEQTWMSLVFQKQKEKLFKVAVLLLSPINHIRIYHYNGSERKEN